MNVSSHPFLTAKELQTIREAISRHQVPGTYEPGKWDVCPNNRRPECLVAPFPKHVTLRDVTLRVIEQTPVVSVTAEERLRLARALIELGVTSLQTSYGRWLDEAAIRREAQTLRNLGYKDVELTATGVVSKEHIDSFIGSFDVVGLYNCSVPEAQPMLFTDVLRDAWKGEDWRKRHPMMNAEEQLEKTASLVTYAKQKGLKPSANVQMLAWASDDYLKRYASTMEKAGAYYINLADGTSGMGPDAYRYVVSLVKKAAPKCKVVAHIHNAFGLGTANCLAAVQGGAEVLEVAMNNMCSAYGQADLAEIAVALEVLYGVDTGIKLEKLNDVSRLVEDITRVPMAQMKPITGKRAWMFATESTVQERKVYPFIHPCIDPKVVGGSSHTSIGQYSGNWSMLDKLQELGVEIDRALVPEVLNQVKSELRIHRRELTDEEFRDIAERVKGMVKT